MTRRKPTPIVDYPPGHFTEPVRAWFGHYWTPTWPTLVTRDYSGHEAQRALMLARERQAESGDGWGSGTIPMAKTPTHSRPAWMAKARE